MKLIERHLANPSLSRLNHRNYRIFLDGYVYHACSLFIALDAFYNPMDVIPNLGV
jgi:hypothetical protein